MDSRAVLPQNQRVGGGKQQKNGEGRHRRALQNIGNLAIAQAIVGRPLTRSMANAQAATAGKKKCNIEIDELELNKSNKTLTSDQKENRLVDAEELKAVRAVSKKPKVSMIVDIDAEDKDNELAAAEYVGDMYNFYKLTEGDGRVHHYLDSQPEINSRMRAILVDWLIEVHRSFQLMPETLYLTVNIVDRFLSMEKVPKKELQLVGIASMLLASKYEEIWAPQVSDFVALSDNAYVREQVLMMEKAILAKVKWYLTVPTPYVFVVRYIKASIPANDEMENMAFFLAELGLTNYSTMTEYSPSMFAASAVYAARCTLGRSSSWTKTLKHYTGYDKYQLMACAKDLVGLHCGVGLEKKLTAVMRKYRDPKRGAVALFPPATALF